MRHLHLSEAPGSIAIPVLRRYLARQPGVAAYSVLCGLAIAAFLPGTGHGQGGVLPTANYKYRLISPICEVSHLNGSFSVAVNVSYKSKLIAENINAAVETANSAAVDADQAAETAITAASASPAGGANPNVPAARKLVAEVKSLAADALKFANQASIAASKAYDAASGAEAEDKARIGAETEKKSEDVLLHVTKRDNAFVDALKSTSDITENTSQVKRLSERAQKLAAEAIALLGKSQETLDAGGTVESADQDKKNASGKAAASDNVTDLVSRIAVLQSALEHAGAFSDALGETAIAQARALQSVQPFCLAKGATVRFEFDADSNWILFVEEGAQFEEGRRFGIDTSRIGIDLSKLGIDLSKLGIEDIGKDKVINGRVVTVPKKNLSPYDIERLEGEGWGIFIVPFKIRDTGKDTRVIPGGSVGPYYGLQLGRLVYFAGLGLSPISISDPNDSIPETRVGYSPVIGVMNLISLSLDWQIGVVLGWDYLGSNSVPAWKGEGQPWVGMIIGTTVLTQSKRVAKVSPE